MSTLFEYSKQVQRFMREARQDLINPSDLVNYINRARREVAEATQCVRRLTPIGGQIVSWTVTNPGSGYSSTPTFTITPPDFPTGRQPSANGKQATATGIVTGGQISAIFSQDGGNGYFLPQMTITDSTGSGATATPTLSWINLLKLGQEVYNFSDVDVSMFPGCGPVFAVKDLSVIYSNYRYSLPRYAFSVYQAMIRQYPNQYEYVPTFCSQFGQGTDGSIYAYPLPSQTYQWEWDCFCLPQDLIDNQSVDVIPQPWSDVVPYFAAHLGYLELQNLNAANFYLQLYDKMCLRKSSYSRIGYVTNSYGRY